MERDTRTPRSATGDETAQALRCYADLFGQRWDAFARQRERSRGYYRVKRADGHPVPLTCATLLRHLRGDITIGLYSLDEHGTTKWSVIDSDRGLEPVREAQARLAERGITTYTELSRAGAHAWLWWLRPVRPDLAKKY